MKFSFIVPIYKKPEVQLRQSLKSLFNMSHKDIEVICVFDGADPALAEVVNEFPVKIVTIDHGGAPKARNEGAKHASGDFLSFWDCDCYAEPEMASMWEITLKQNLHCDFCYSGYAWGTATETGIVDAGMKPFESEPFDPAMLEHYNYIASMFPLAKDKFPGWDESLTGLQDWDYWRRVVRAGSRGAFIEGQGFITEPPDAASISGGKDEAELFEKTRSRIEAVRKKLGDPQADVVVHGLLYKRYTARAAKVLGADFIWNPWWLVKPYRLSLMVGFHPKSLDIIRKTVDKTDKATKRVIYWMGSDAEAFYTAPFWQARTVLKDFEGRINAHFCDGARSKEILSHMGIDAEVLPFPHDEETKGIDLPQKFKVLVLTDDSYSKAMDGVVKALPDIEFTRVVPDTYYNIMDYTVSIQYTRNPRLDNETKGFLMKGRYVISNVDEPHSGHIPVGDDFVKFKNAIIDRLRELKAASKPNMEAREFYLAECSPEKFREKIIGLMETKLEVVA